MWRGLVGITYDLRFLRQSRTNSIIMLENTLPLVDPYSPLSTSSSIISNCFFVKVVYVLTDDLGVCFVFFLDTDIIFFGA